MSTATARACANIALIKYWGKRNAPLNLPARGSLSLTLGALTTTSTIRFTQSDDSLSIDGNAVTGKALQRLTEWLDLVRAMANTQLGAQVESHSSFPTASGLASSASAFAALAVAANQALELGLDARQLSILARRGSGSAARSVFGGFARMHQGTAEDGSDCFAEAIESPWTDELAMIIAIVGGGKKKAHSSRDAMQHCARTSPLYQAWLESVDPDLSSAQAAIAAQDLAALGELSEASALCMHASMWAARPAIVYWQDATIRCMEVVRGLREKGHPCYYTMDAGPHVKVLTTREHQDHVANALRDVADVGEVMQSAVGGEPELLS